MPRWLLAFCRFKPRGQAGRKVIVIGAGLAGLSAARALQEALSDAATHSDAHDALKAKFGNTFPAPITGQVARWSRDPFTLGSYSFNAVGVTPKNRKAPSGADWDGQLLFAGEATSTDYFGTAHGAVLSGRSAAKLIPD